MITSAFCRCCRDCRCRLLITAIRTTKYCRHCCVSQLCDKPTLFVYLSLAHFIQLRCLFSVVELFFFFAFVELVEDNRSANVFISAYSPFHSTNTVLIFNVGTSIIVISLQYKLVSPFRIISHFISVNFHNTHTHTNIPNIHHFFLSIAFSPSSYYEKKNT